MHQLTVLSPETPSRREDLLFDSTSLFFERTHKLLQKIKNKQPARSFGVAQASGTQQSPRYQPRCQPVFQGPQHSYYQDLLSRPTSRLSRIFLLTKAWFRPTTGKQCRPQNLPADWWNCIALLFLILTMGYPIPCPSGRKWLLIIE